MFEKQLQTTAATFFSFGVLLIPIIAPILLGLCVIYGNVLRYLAIAYIAFTIYDVKYNYGLDMAKKWWSGNIIFRLTASYFSLKMVETEKLKGGCNYLIGLHPHGLVTLCAMNIAYRAGEDYQRIFRPDDVSFCTAPFNMLLPLQRDWFRAGGAISASEKSILRRLTSKPSGRHVALSVGGADEALVMSPDDHSLILKKRKGFCRIALMTGTHLIPSYAFGENQVWDTIRPAENTFLYKIQRFLLNNFQIGFAILKGTGKYHLFFVVPRRTPITLVLGKPIPVAKVVNPSREQVNELHTKYVQALVELFDTHKEQYLGDKNAQLIIN